MTTHTNSQGAQSGDTNDGTNSGDTPNESIDMENYSADQLLAAITGKPLDGREPEAPPAPAPTAASETPDDGSTHQSTTEQQEQANRGALRVRLSALPPDQQTETIAALNLVRDGKAADMLDALSQLRGTPNATHEIPDADLGEQAPDPAPVNDAIAELENQLTELQDQRRAARAEFDADAEDILTRQIETLNRKIAKEEARAELAENQQADAVVEYEQAYQTAVVELEQQYPDVLDDDSEFTTLLADKMEAAKFRKDRGLSDPRFILARAAEVHALLYKPSGRKPTPPPATPRATGSAVAPSYNQTPPQSADQMRMAIENADPSDILQVLAAGKR